MPYGKPEMHSKNLTHNNSETYRFNCYKVVVAVMTVRCATFIIGNLFPFARRNGALLFQQFTCSPKKTPLFCLCFLGASPPKIIGYIKAYADVLQRGRLQASDAGTTRRAVCHFFLQKGTDSIFLFLM